MVIAAMLIWGSIGIFRRHIPVPSEFLAFIRGLLGAAFMSVFLLKHSLQSHTSKAQSTDAGRAPVSRRSLYLLAITGGLIGLNWILLFEAFSYTTVAVATLCYYMEPTMVILLAPLLLGDRLTASKLLTVVLTIAGMVFVSGILETEALSDSAATGIAFGLSAALAYAIIVIMNKRIEAVDTYLKTFIQLLSAALVMIPYLMATDGFSAIPAEPAVRGLLLTVGIVHTGIAYALYFGGMKGLSAQSVAICSYVDPVSALLLSAWLLGESLTPLGLLGATLIIGAAAASELGLTDRLLRS